MTDAETEAETLERLEFALRRIGELARQPKKLSGTAASGPEIDRAALLHSLDLLITRLRNGLESPTPHPGSAKPVNDGVTE
jgi:hypothetical protein